jgi:hypothetical protein
MAFGDYSGPDKPNKGHEAGACNRQRCQSEPANWYNHGMNKWYCDDCRRAIQFDPVNLRGWQRDWQPRLGHPQFETREMITKREAPPVDIQSRHVMEALKKLTEAQRDALGREYVRTDKGLEMRWQHEITAPCRVALQRMGIFYDNMYSTLLTDFGIAVREEVLKFRA